MTTPTRQAATLREFVLVADASADECSAAEKYLTEHEGDDISISVRPWGAQRGQVEGLFEIVNGQRMPAALRYDEDQDIEERIDDLIRAAWEHVAGL